MKPKTPGGKRISISLAEDLVRALEKMAADHKRELPAMIKICLKWATWKYRLGESPENELLSANRADDRAALAACAASRWIN